MHIYIYMYIYIYIFTTLNPNAWKQRVRRRLPEGQRRSRPLMMTLRGHFIPFDSRAISFYFIRLTIKVYWTRFIHLSSPSFTWGWRCEVIWFHLIRVNFLLFDSHARSSYRFHSHIYSTIHTATHPYRCRAKMAHEWQSGGSVSLSTSEEDAARWFHLIEYGILFRFRQPNHEIYYKIVSNIKATM